jgi:uncharacterized DUF497 family protein
VTYEWDPAKAASNASKHQVSFEEAASFLDPDHSAEEDREVTIGRSARKRILLVAHTERGNRIRIISARLATRREQDQYEEGSSEATQ